MHEKLNIPLEQTPTRRHSWRVVWIPLVCLLAFLLSWSIFRLIISHDSTSNLYPIDRTSTIRIIKTPQNIKLLNKKIGNEPILAGSTWTIHDILQKSDSEFAIHLENDEIIAITTDKPLENNDISILESLGFNIKQEKKSFIFGKGDFVHEDKLGIIASSVLPWHDGEYYDTEKQKTNEIVINNTGITIKSGHKNDNLPENLKVNEDLEIIAHMPISLTQKQFPLISEFIISDPLFKQVLDEATGDWSIIAIGKDALGTFINIDFTSEALTIEELAKFAEQAISQVSLSTLALTIEDDTVVQELRTNTRLIESSINNKGDSTIITSKNKSGDIITIVKNSDKISLINRDLFALDSQISIKSSCLPNSELFMNPSEILNITSFEVGEFLKHQEKSSLFMLFSEIAIDKRKTRLCW